MRKHADWTTIRPGVFLKTGIFLHDLQEDFSD
jgi:hypothetical protein